MIRAALIAAALMALYLVATAPALWWVPEAERVALAEQVAATHGPAAANFIKNVCK